jgi:hypothetical protein
VVELERKNWTSACSCATWACKFLKACIGSIVKEEDEDEDNKIKKKREPGVNLGEAIGVARTHAQSAYAEPETLDTTACV